MKIPHRGGLEGVDERAPGGFYEVFIIRSAPELGENAGPKTEPRHGAW